MPPTFFLGRKRRRADPPLFLDPCRRAVVLREAPQLRVASATRFPQALVPGVNDRSTSDASPRLKAGNYATGGNKLFSLKSVQNKRILN